MAGSAHWLRETDPRVRATDEAVPYGSHAGSMQRTDLSTHAGASDEETRQPRVLRPGKLAGVA
jgi:hypothetical protein